MCIRDSDKTIYCLNCDFKEHKPANSQDNEPEITEPKVFNIDDFRPKKS